MGAGPGFVWSYVGSVVLFSTRTGLVDIETERELLWKELAFTESEKMLPYWACGKSNGGDSGVALAAVEFIVSSDCRWLVRLAFIFE